MILKSLFSRCISHFLICFFNVHLLAYLISFKGVFTQGFLGALTFFFNSFPLQFPMLFHLFDLTFKCVFSFTILGCFHFFRTFWLLVVFCQIPKLLTCSFCKHSCFDFC